MKKAVKIENFIDSKLENQSDVRNSLRLERKKWIEKNEYMGTFDVDSDESISHISEEKMKDILNVRKNQNLGEEENL